MSKFLKSLVIFSIIILAGCNSYDEGYMQGESDCVKEMYWNYQSLQKAKNPEQNIKYRYYTIDGPTKGPNGVNYSKHRLKVKVME